MNFRQSHPAIPWVAGFYLFAPSLWEWLQGKPGPGLPFTMYRPFQQWALRRIFRDATMILVTGEEDRERFIQLGRSPESVFAVRGGVDLSIPRQVPDGLEKRYEGIFIGRLHPQKGVHDLLAIWRLLQKNMKNASNPLPKLAIIGTGPLENALKAEVEGSTLKGSVEFLGFLDGVEKYRIIKASRVVVHPAVYDSGGMAPAEALACGLPGVAFDLPSLKTYYPQGFLKATPGSHGEFAGHLERLLMDDILYLQKSQEALEEGQAWDWNLRARQVMEAITAGCFGKGRA